MNNIKYSLNDPICAIATALAPAALGIIRCSGEDSLKLVSKIFSRPKMLLNAAGNTLIYGWIVDNSKRIDEVVISVYRAPKSFTGENMVEISCHGGVCIVSSIHKLLLKNGFRQAERGEFTFRAYINGKSDLTKAEAVQEIIESRTKESGMRAAGRLSGNLFEEINSIKKMITDTIASIEVEIEYPEDEETIADSFDNKALKKARDRLCELSSSWQSEKLYQDGVKIVLAGKTNAGKSSLFNALLKEERALVSSIEGTTRDWLESWIDLDGIPVKLFDTAGLRKTIDEVEAQGIELTFSLSKEADFILYLLDSSQDDFKSDIEFLSKCLNPVIIIWNKCDLVDKVRFFSKNDKSKIPLLKAEFALSAKNFIGIDKLCSDLKLLIAKENARKEFDAALGSLRQKAAVDGALECVSHALDCIGGFTLDAAVEDLEEALSFLGEITGEICADDILNSIFKNFCVGK